MINYQSFKARSPRSFNFHPYLLKEFRNRWFLIGVKTEDDPVLTLALDRIVDIQPSAIPFITREDFDPEEYFRDVIGVTVNPDQEPDKVRLFVTHKHAQYVVTKPLHHSQKVVAKDSKGITFEIEVQLNYELEKEILGLGDGVMVISPQRLKRNIAGRLKKALDSYKRS